MKKIELLSPAGSLANLKAAIAKGADAVYLGLNKFNAREKATNFNHEYLKEAVKLCKSNDVRLYLTMNTLVKNNELKDFFNELSYAYESGIDSVIIQDISFAPIIKRSFPGLKIHISTQAGIMNSNHANLVQDIDRIVLAREIGKENIRTLRKKYNKELEIFVHGALCISVSGSCLFSSFIGGRSGNRGKCAQPCRKKYNDCFYLSTKELCLIDKIPELIDMKIDSLKIEGRMRSPYYVATVTDIYRKAIDSYYNGNFIITPEMRNKLISAFSRDFTQGCYAGENVFNKKRAEGFTKNIIENYNVNKKEIILEKRKSNINLPEITNKANENKQIIVKVYNINSAKDADISGADIIIYDLFNKDFKELKKQINKPIYAATPRIMFDSDISIIEKKIKEINPDGLFVGNLGLLNMDFKIPMILDYNSNCFNDVQLDYYSKLVDFIVISPELSIKEMTEFKNKDFACFVHGKLILMNLAHKIPETTIKDEKSYDFNIQNIYNGVEIINQKELGLFNKIRPLLKSGIKKIYIDTDNNTKEIVNIYKEILNGKTIDVTKIKKDYVLGWSEKGVL
jgi:collagenase-like PrtC family protease